MKLLRHKSLVGIPRWGMHSAVLAGVAILAVAASLAWNLQIIRNEVHDAAHMQAQAAFDQAVLYRRWCAGHGGVYVPITKDTPANPHLANVKDRDITTSSGKRLTLVNPAYMTRQVFELAFKDAGAQGHITSLKPIRRRNAPTPWEAQSLRAFEQGEIEASQIAKVDGKPYLSYMKPLFVEQQCLKCHAAQGYKLGDVRGGIRVSVPIAPFTAAAATRRTSVYLAHSALLLVALCAITIGALRQRASEQRRMRSERELELSHSLLRATLESTADGILVVGTSGQIEMCNNRFIEMWGIPPGVMESGEDSKALDTVLSQLTHPEAFLARVHELYSQPEATSFDCVEFKDGRVYERYSQPQRIGDSIHGRVWSFRDVTERRQSEKELLNSIDAANEANAAKSNFLANVSHEIRTPMNGILGMTELALQTDLTAEQRDYLDTAKTSAESLLTLIDQILDFSKGETGHMSLESTKLSLRALVRQAIQTVAPQAAAKRLELICDIAESTPDSLIGDPLRLRQVLVNLLGNAVKFTNEGSVRLSATVEQAESGAANLRVSVSDTGIGIPDDKKETIFEPFAQADDSTTRNYGGTGLGLAISKQLVEMMNGTLAVVSESGKGSTFTFTAQVKISGQFAEVGDARVKSASRSNNEKSLRILVVDDNPVNRKVSKSILAKRGHDVTAIADGQEALEAILADDFDVVLMDVQLAVMDGLCVTQAVRRSEEATGGHVPIVALTGQATAEDRERCLAAGMDEYVSKPIRADDLIEAIDRACESKRARASSKDKAA